MLDPRTRAATILLAMLTGVPAFGTSMFMPSLPDIARGLSASPAEVQLSISSYLFGLACGQVFYGTVSDRFGRKPVMLAALGLFTLATVVCAVAPTIEIFVIGRAVQAIGGAGAIVVTRAIVRDSHEGARAARELSLISSFMALAPIVAPVIGGMLQVWFGWRSAFVALVVFTTILFAVVVLVLPETIRHRSTQGLSFGNTLRSFRGFLRDRAFIANVLLGGGAFAGGYAWLSGSSFVLQDLHGLSVVEYSWVYVFSTLGYLIGTFAASRLVMRHGVNFTMGVGATALALSSLAMVAGLAWGQWPVLAMAVPSLVFLAGMGLVMPQSIAASLMLYPKTAGAASSLAGFIQQSGGAIAAAVVGHFLGTSAWPVAAAMLVTGLAVFALWSVSRGVRTRPAVVPAE